VIRVTLDVLLAHLPAPIRQSRLARPGALYTPRAATTLFALACVALSLSVVFLWWVNGLRETHLAELQRLQAELSAPPPAAEVPAPSPDFTRSLPRQAPLQAVVEAMHKEASGTGLQVAELQVAQQQATVQRLGRTDLTVLVQGRYPDMKAWLAHLVERFPSLTLGELTMTRIAGSDQIQGRFLLQLWTQPLAPADVAGPGLNGGR
jgi:hypothetical protein